MQSFLSSFGIDNILSGQYFFLLILVAAGIGLGALIGRYRLVALLAGVYFGAATFSAVPKDILPGDPVIVLLLFTAIVLAFTFLDEYLFDVNAVISQKMWKSVAVGFLAIGAYASSAASLVPWNTVADVVSKETYGFLTDPWWRFFWMTAPLLFLFLMNKRRR